jgi:Uma2 family endonuclease
LTDAGAEGPPDFVVAILSLKTRQVDLVNKKRVYARLGVKELWIIDPEPGAVAIYRFEQNPDQPVTILYSSDATSTSLLPGFSMQVSAIFRRP